MISTGVLVLIFAILLIPNVLGFKGFFASGETADLVAYNVGSSSVVIDGVIGTDEYASSYTDTDNDITIYVEHNGTYLFIGLECSDPGWCAVGFNDLDASHPMSGADIKMGYVVDSNGTTVLEDKWAKTLAAPVLDDPSGTSVNNIEAFAGKQTGTSTTIEMVLKMGVGDDKDKVLTEGSTYLMLYAQADIDDTTTIHDQRGKITFLISSEPKP